MAGACGNVHPTALAYLRGKLALPFSTYTHTRTAIWLIGYIKKFSKVSATDSKETYNISKSFRRRLGSQMTKYTSQSKFLPQTCLSRYIGIYEQRGIPMHGADLEMFTLACDFSPFLTLLYRKCHICRCKHLVESLLKNLDVKNFTWTCSIWYVLTQWIDTAKGIKIFQAVVEKSTRVTGNTHLYSKGLQWSIWCIWCV